MKSVIENANDISLLNDAGEEIGFIKIASEGFGVYRIELIKINEKFRGLGFYRKLITVAFENIKMNTLYSFNRCELSNAIYRFWTGDADLSPDRRVWIELIDGSLKFTIDE